jgi:gluconokinase
MRPSLTLGGTVPSPSLSQTDPQEGDPAIVVVMGVAGSGKTTIGQRLATTLGWSYAEGDAFHPAANIAKMEQGIPLSDADRWPWLDAIAGWIRAETAAGRSGVVACSALRRTYRDRLRAAWPALRLVVLDVDSGELRRRLHARAGHFFPERLLESQLATLEMPQAEEHALVVPPGDASAAVDRIAAIVRTGSWP